MLQGGGGFAQEHKLSTGSPLIGKREVLPRKATSTFPSANTSRGVFGCRAQFKELREGSSGTQ